MADHKLESAGGFSISSGRATLSVHAPMPENHPMLSIIGQVANQWAHIEHILDLIIWDLSGLEPSKGALSITAQLLGSQARFKTIISLAPTRRLSKAIITRTTKLKTVCRRELKKGIA
jgi:hypothetical protein